MRNYLRGTLIVATMLGLTACATKQLPPQKPHYPACGNHQVIYTDLTKPWTNNKLYTSVFVKTEDPNAKLARQVAQLQNQVKSLMNMQSGDSDTADSIPRSNVNMPTTTKVKEVCLNV